MHLSAIGDSFETVLRGRLKKARAIGHTVGWRKDHGRSAGLKVIRGMPSAVGSRRIGFRGCPR